MIHLTRGLIRKWLDALLHIQDTPERTAAAFAFGVFIGFSPFLGLHTLLGVLFAFLLNLNRVAVLLGVYSNLPWFLGPYYVGTTMIGARMLGYRLPRDFGMQLADLFALSLFGAQFWNAAGSRPEAPLLAVLPGVHHRVAGAGGGGVPSGTGVHHQPPPDSRPAAAQTPPRVNSLKLQILEVGLQIRVYEIEIDNQSEIGNPQSTIEA